MKYLPRRYNIAILILFIAIGCFLYISPWAEAAYPNDASPLGTNLEGVANESAEQPFIDIFKTSGSWITSAGAGCGTATHEEAMLDLDTNGWLKSMTPTGGQSGTYTCVVILLERQAGALNYPAGRYIVTYDGEGTVVYGFDAVKNQALSTSGRDVLDVATPSANGIAIAITATDPSHTDNYIRNIKVFDADHESLLSDGEIFNPDFLSKTENFRALRFMDWMKTNNSTQSSWAGRPVQSLRTYGLLGVPAEVMVELANQLHADPWFNMPHTATDDYITEFATLAHEQLGTDSVQKVYVEYSNEVWNSRFSQYTYAETQGIALWPSASSADAIANYYGTRSSEMCDLWKSAWGQDASRVICVMSGPASSPTVNQTILDCPLSTEAPCYSNADALAIAPYFAVSNGVVAQWSGESDGGVTQIFEALTTGNSIGSGVTAGGILLENYTNTMLPNKAVADARGLDFLAYEGGQDFNSGGDSTLQTLYAEVNRDSRMNTAYTTYLNYWKQASGSLFMHYTDTGSYVSWNPGTNGSLESITQTSSPKYDALQSFISNNDCWWVDCLRDIIIEEAQVSDSSILGIISATINSIISKKPEVIDVSATATDTSITITWKTDRAANSIVRYGLNKNLRKKRTEIRRESKHQMILRNLTPDTRYFFRVSSQTSAGRSDRSRIHSVRTSSAH